jgi:transcriptional regulator with XRE-family HTH domain
MPPASFATPAQIVAGRAMLGLSQEDLATAAKVSPSTLRDLEAGRRPADGDAARAVYRELDNRGLAFIPSDAAGGPGVRLASHRPTLLRLPTVVTKWEGVPLEIEFQGRPRVAFVSREALEDLDRIPGSATDAQLLATVERHRGRILEAAWRLIVDEKNLDKHGQVHIRTMDLDGAPETRQPSACPGIDQLAQYTRVTLDPLPRRIWRGQKDTPQDHTWLVDRVDLAKGLVVINNEVTGHYLHLYHPAHLRRVARIGQPGERPEFVLQLGVQVVFEDGHARLEHRRAPNAKS